jgi:diguanylate cyclase
VLAQFARRIESNLRCYDQFARLGGEEFVVVLPHCNLADGIAMAERLRKSISDTIFIGNSSPKPVTVSVGVTTLHAGETQIDEALKRADAALYAAKDKGRNRVDMAP